jgi:hypothetical protein
VPRFRKHDIDFVARQASRVLLRICRTVTLVVVQASMLRLAHRVRGCLRWVVNLVLHEWLLTQLRFGNGGDIILVRSVLVATQVYALVLAAKICVDPNSSCDLQGHTLRASLIATGAWYGPIFAGIYASLYARYASQWTYLANVYNRIKETEARAPAAALGTAALAQWKAGFIEDADDLHLATKPLFAGVIRAWAEPEVEQAFKLYTRGGEERWRAILRRIDY